MKLATVVPLKKGVFKEELTYFTSKEVVSGNIVSIPFRSKKILGLVVATENVSGSKESIKDLPFNLKKILEVKEESIFLKEYLQSALLVGRYFAAKKNDSVASLLPSAFREEYDKLAKHKNKIFKIKKEKIESTKKIKSERALYQAPLVDRISYYKTLIRGNFAEKKSVFMILPTEHDIDTFSEAISKGIENFTFTIHGSLSPKKQIEKFSQIINSEHPVLVLGTAPYLSIPRTDFGTIILEHESSNAYKMISRPHFDLRTFVELYALKIEAKLILSDTLLRFETISRRDTDSLAEIYSLSFRTNFDGQIYIPDQKTENAQINVKNTEFKILSEESITAIQNSIDKKQNVFIFALRKGLATMTVCRDCSESVMCENCNAPVVLYLSKDSKKRMFVCNKCGTEKDPEMTCRNCGSWNLVPLGIGTDTVYEEISRIFKNTKILQLDKEIAKTAKGAEKIAQNFEEYSGAILIGTEMALFYLKEKVPLSIITSFDSLWSIPNFKMSEKVVQLLFSIISKTKDLLIIQTKNERDPAIRSVKNENIISFVRQELEDRKNLGYPPFKRFIKITHVGDKTQTIKAKTALAEVFKDYNPDIFSGFVSKIKNQYITNALIKLELKNWSLPEIHMGASIDQNLFEKLLLLPSEFSVIVDPEDLL